MFVSNNECEFNQLHIISTSSLGGSSNPQVPIPFATVCFFACFTAPQVQTPHPNTMWWVYGKRIFWKIIFLVGPINGCAQSRVRQPIISFEVPPALPPIIHSQWGRQFWWYPPPIPSCMRGDLQDKTCFVCSRTVSTLWKLRKLCSHYLIITDLWNGAPTNTWMTPHVDHPLWLFMYL